MVKDIIGLMSGTSLDGLDICYVRFDGENADWKYTILKAESEQYPLEISNSLATAQSMTAAEYALFNSNYGLYIGERVKAFMERNNCHPDLIASHGHTIFHQPGKRFTAQIGSGAGIAAETGVDCVCDFRTTDVALYGQGAPLVPIGDRLLFKDYDYCLNIGGFSNVSFDKGESREAYDISPANYVLNHYARLLGFEYDKDGEIARSGNVDVTLLGALNHLDFYNVKGPKSLGREFVESEVIPLIDSYGLSTADVLSTFCEHIACQMSRNIFSGRVLVTGGGAFNTYLIERMRAKSPKCEYIIPDPMTISFKEALIFAFLGLLYINDIPNCLSTVTGAKYDCIGGALYKSGK